MPASLYLLDPTQEPTDEQLLQLMHGTEHSFGMMAGMAMPDMPVVGLQFGGISHVEDKPRRESRHKVSSKVGGKVGSKIQWPPRLQGTTDSH